MGFVTRLSIFIDMLNDGEFSQNASFRSFPNFSFIDLFTQKTNSKVGGEVYK